MRRLASLLLPMSLFSLLLLRCGPAQPDTSQSSSAMYASQPKPEFMVRDSAAIRTYEGGLQIYLVRTGPGTRPIDGSVVKLHYQVRLPNGTIVDDTWKRKEPFQFILGQTDLIAGMEAALRKIRMGSRAVVMIPAALAYTGEDRPKGIPANSPLIYELELLGYIY